MMSTFQEVSSTFVSRWTMKERVDRKGKTFKGSTSGLKILFIVQEPNRGSEICDKAVSQYEAGKFQIKSLTARLKRLNVFVGHKINISLLCPLFRRNKNEDEWKLKDGSSSHTEMNMPTPKNE